MAARFEVEVLTKFRSVGLSQIAQEARSALSQVANTPGISSAQRVTRASQVRVEAERAIATQAAGQLATVRASGLTGNQLAAAEAAVKREASQARRAVTRLFDEVTRETTDLGRRLARAVRNAGTPILTAAQARGAVPLTPPPPTAAEARAAERLARAQTRAQAESILTADPNYYAAQQAARRSASDRAAREAAQKAADEVYLRNSALLNAAKKEEAERIRALTLGIQGATTAPISEVRVAAALQQKVNADLQAAAVARARTIQEQNATSVIARASAERRAAERELTAAIHLNARQEVQQAIAAGQGTRFQRLQARFQAGGSARLPSEFQGLGQFVGSRALTTIGYGIAGTALYGGVRAIGEMIREAEELDRVLNQIEAQLSSVGSGDQFEGVRAGILRIARETGAAADEVARVQFQFGGAFGALADGSIDSARALTETEAAMKVVAVTGLSLEEVLDSLTATARTFNVGIEEIGDQALGVQERFGVLATETIKFVADLAPVAEQIGLSLEDLASLGGVAQQVSGRSGAALAEGFGRIFPQLQELRGAILEIYDLPQLAGQRGGIIEAFAGGETGAVFQRLVRDFDALSKSQQAFVIDMLGGRREAQVLIPVLQNASILTRDWDRNLAGLNDSSGKTDDYFARLQTTVSNAGARFGEAVRQIGEGLFRAGAADAFVAITNAAAGLADVISFLVNVFGGFNNTLDGAPVRILAYVAAFRLLRAAAGVTSRAITQKTAATVRDTSGSAANAVANRNQAAALGQVAGSSRAAASGVAADTAADIANTASSTAAARANQVQNSANAVSGLYAPSGGRLGSFANTIMGGGSLFGRQIGGRAGGLLNVGRSFSGLVGMTLVMEGLNQYFNNASEQAAELDKLRSELQEQFAETADIDRVAEQQLQRAAQLRARGENEGIQGGGVLGRAVNFIGGKTMELFGGDADAILRTAAGEPQDYEVIEQEATAARSEQYRDLITRVLADTGTAERLVVALQRADLNALNEAIQNNPDFVTDPVRQAFVEGGGDDLGRYLQDLEDGLVDKKDITEENLRVLISAAQAGDQVAAEMLRLISDHIRVDPELQALLNDATEREAVEAAGGAGNFQLQTIEQARQRFEEGSTSVGTYLREARQAREGIRDAIAAYRRRGEEPLVEDLLALAKADQEIDEIIGNAALARIDALGTIADLTGGAQGGAALAPLLDQQIQAVRQFLSEGTGTQEQRFAQVPELIGLLRDKFEYELSLIADDAERARREAQGFQIPPELQAVLVEQQLVASPEISAAIEQYAALARISLEDAFLQAAVLIATTNMTVQQVTVQLIRDAITKLQDQLRETFKGLSPNQIEHSALANEIAGQIAELEALIPTVPDVNIEEIGSRGYNAAKSGADDAARRAEEARRAARARAEAQLDIQRAQAEGDPEALARIDLQAAEIARRYAEDDAQRLQAEAARIRAWNAIREAQEDIDRARYELYAAQVQRDPVRAAQAQVTLAYIAIVQARGTAERIRAQIQMVNAQAQLLQAQQDVTYAWLEGVQSYYTIIGDSVRAAQAALTLARQQLKDIIADPASGAAERQRAQTAVAEAEAAVRNARYDDQLGDIEYMLELEKISVAQAIQMLQRMAEIPGLTEEQLRNIERRIRALREEVSGDLAFNLPDIQLPTLYEVRRLMGSGQTPSGTYQDNRQIAVTLQISENVDAGAVMNQLSDLLNAPSITGIYPRNY
jgi:hypothetical protein